MNYRINEVRTAMQLLFLVAEQPGLTLPELAELSETTPTRALTLLDSLQRNGMVERDESLPTYYLGRTALAVAALARQHYPSVYDTSRAFAEEDKAHG